LPGDPHHQGLQVQRAKVAGTLQPLPLFLSHPLPVRLRLSAPSTRWPDRNPCRRGSPPSLTPTPAATTPAMSVTLYALITFASIVGVAAVTLYYFGARGRRKERLEAPKYKILDDDRDDFPEE